MQNRIDAGRSEIASRDQIGAPKHLRRCLGSRDVYKRQLVRWYKDIGSRVTKGELLAKIDTPEVDQELNQTCLLYTSRCV